MKDNIFKSLRHQGDAGMDIHDDAFEYMDTNSTNTEKGWGKTAKPASGAAKTKSAAAKSAGASRAKTTAKATTGTASKTKAKAKSATAGAAAKTKTAAVKVKEPANMNMNEEMLITIAEISERVDNVCCTPGGKSKGTAKK